MIRLVLILVCLLVWPGRAFADGFGTGLAVVPDRDGDGVSELLIGVSSAAELPPAPEEGAAKSKSPNSTEPSVGLVLLSPGKGKCIRIIEHGLRLSAGSSPFALLESKAGESPRVAYLARELDGFAKTYLIVADIDTGEEFSRTEFKGIRWGEGGPNIWRLGDVDGKPGDEFLLRHSDPAYDYEFGLTWYKALVVAPKQGVLREEILGYGIDLVGDVSGDGVIDYVATDASCHPVFSGKTGEELFKAEERDEARDSGGIIRRYAAGDSDVLRECEAKTQAGCSCGCCVKRKPSSSRQAMKKLGQSDYVTSQRSGRAFFREQWHSNRTEAFSRRGGC